MQEIEKLRDQIRLNNGFGAELFEKNEFRELAKYFDKNESLVCAMVCQIASELYLVAFSAARLFVIKRSTILGSKVKRIGLEDISDIELINDGELGQLVFSFYSTNQQLKMEAISLVKAQKFGKQLVGKIQTWNQDSQDNWKRSF